MIDIPIKYDYITVEKKWREYWEQNNIYSSKVNKNKNKFSIVIPPPNVTGILHIGHILNNTIQDIYCRWKRMKGFEVCWVPGTDHAGIATQLKVEEELKNLGKTKEEIGRNEFLKKVWEWKEKHGGIILKQLKQLGASLDWQRERFTLDDGLSHAVKSVFVDLYNKGLIYKGKRIINWDISSQTALSDDEIEFKEIKDKLYYIKYFFENSNDFLVIATSRPETIFGDTAVAVNSKDARYNNLKYNNVIIPLINKIIPIIYDDYVDIEFGTGALKVTPAHDINDFELGEKHNLEFVNILSKDGKLNENSFEFKGLEISKAREAVVKKLREKDLLVKEEEYTHNVSFAQRSGAVIEPYLSDQWFVSMKKLAEPAINAVKEGKIRFHPERYKKIYFHWLENVRDWCISRQLWWGHQIPIWYSKNSNDIYCNISPPDDIENWIQDPDVLDTWFSSWLWPFSVFGWELGKNDNEDLNYYYPTDFLSTASDIIYLWVARMIMAGMEYMKDVPFRDVYFHSIVRDGKGRKMSKTLGNSPDPLNVMEEYGTDALRFTIVYLAPLGNDVLFDKENTEIGRNFVTKLWNAGRFLSILKQKYTNASESKNYQKDKDLIDTWIESRLNSTLIDAENLLDNYKLNEYAKLLYNFVWSEYCDWYIELCKSRVNINPENAEIIINNAFEIYSKVLKLLHPIIPFVTEELWNLLFDAKTKSLSFEDFPIANTSVINHNVNEHFEYYKDLITTIRNEKNKYKNIKDLKYDLKIIKLNTKAGDVYEKIKIYIPLLLNIEGKIDLLNELDSQIHQDCSTGNYFAVFFNFFEGNPLLKINQNKEKISKEINKLESYISILKSKISNEKFLNNASKEVIEKEKKKYYDSLLKLEKLRKIE